MKNSVLGLSCLGLLLQACHSNRPGDAPGQTATAANAAKFEHAKQEAKRDDIAMQQQLEKLRAYERRQAKPASKGTIRNSGGKD